MGKRLTIMKGLPASGKSTKAEEIIQKVPNTVRINKDLIRTMLHFDKWDYKKEKKTQEAARLLAKHFLDEHVNVIIDDTNMNPKTFNSWRVFGEENDAHIEVVDMNIGDIDDHVRKCIDRDFIRDKYVGKGVIQKMALEHTDYMKNHRVIICDLDGTLCDIEHRKKFVDGTVKKDWKAFFEMMTFDEIRSEVVDILNAYKDCKIVFVSGRPENYRYMTVAWLETHFKGNYECLIMREKNDSRPDYIVKSEIYDRYLKNMDIVKVIDDRPQVIINTWFNKVGKDKVIDVGNNEYFKDEREKYNYWV